MSYPKNQGHAALLYTEPSGRVGSVSGSGLQPLIDAAQRARVTGLVNEIPIDRGVVLADWRSGVVYQFVVDPAIRAAVAKPGRTKKGA